MSIIHKTSFPAEALDELKAAAEAVTKVQGVLGYKILKHPETRTVVLHLEVESEATFDAIKKHGAASRASEALWKAHPPQSHEFFEVHSQSY